MITKEKILIVLSVGVLVAIGIALFMFFKPARDIQATKTDYSYNASDIVNEYLVDANKANNKYLDDEGNSKVLEITGIVANITKDFNKQKVMLLKNSSDKAGVSATFTQETNTHTNRIKVGDKITVKGVIRSGASYDEDLEMYENVILDKCDIVTQQINQ
jgi:RecG-like helicase